MFAQIDGHDPWYTPSPSAAVIDPEEMRYRQSLYYMDKEKKPNFFKRFNFWITSFFKKAA